MCETSQVWVRSPDIELDGESSRPPKPYRWFDSHATTAHVVAQIASSHTTEPRESNMRKPLSRRRFMTSAVSAAAPLLTGCGAGESLPTADPLKIVEHGIRRATAADPDNSRRVLESNPTQDTATARGRLITTVLLSADRSITPSTSEIVTFGLPLSPNRVSGDEQIRVVLNGNELAIACVTGLKWHHLGGSPRSVTIQLAVDMSRGDVLLRVEDGGRNTRRDTPLRPIDT